MSSFLKNYLEASGLSQSEHQECTIFMFGQHGVGKSRLISGFSQRFTNSQIVFPSKSTFGYEITSLPYNNNKTVQFYEFTELNNENINFVNDLIQENAKNACICILFDCKNLSKAQDNIDKFFLPLCEHCLVKLDSKLVEDYPKYLSTLFTEDQIEIPSESNNVGLPIFFIGTFHERLDNIDNIMFDGYLKSIRKIAFNYGAGISLSSSKSLLDVLVTCASRLPLENELRNQIGNRTDYFLPPGWDSLEKLNVIEDIPYEEKEEEVKSTKLKEIPDLHSFLNSLSAIKREETPNVKITQKENVKETDFLSKFE